MPRLLPFDLGDTGNDVGGTALATGNTILNFGGGTSATTNSTGVYSSGQWDYNCSYNTINNNDGGGVNHPSILRGIFMDAAVSASATASFNNITIHGGGTTSQISFIQNSSGSTPAGNTININNNTCTGDYLTATSGVFYGLYNNATAAVVNIQNNTISNVMYGGLGQTGTGANYMIYHSVSNAGLTLNITNNSVTNYSRLGTTGGTTIGIYVSTGTGGMMVNVLNNTVDNLSIDGTGTSSILYGIQTSTGTITCNNNTVSNLNVLKTTGTSAMYGIYNIGSPVDENFNNNTVRDLTHAGTGIVYGIYLNTTTGTRTFSFNTIYNITGGGTTIAGSNQLSSSPNIFKNKIYNIQSTSSGAPTVSGLILGSVGTAGMANVYNNLIGDIKAPNASSSSATAPTLRGINVTATTTNSMINLSYNTVYLNGSSTGANFATAALYRSASATATTGDLTLLNNIFINLSTPSGTGNTVAYHRSSTALDNYNVASNNNLFYAGTPGAANLIFFDGTNASQTLSDFKVAVAPRETNSVSENLTFLSTSGTSADFLHLDPAVPTQVESGGVNVAGITDDFDGVIRQGNPGYLGTGSAPDMGADEGEFIGVDLSGPSISYDLLPNSICLTPYTLNAEITDATGVNTSGGTKPRLWYKKSTENNALPATNTAADNGWKYVEASNASSPFTFTIDYSLLNSPIANGDVIEYFVVAQDIVMPPNVGTNIAIYNGGFVPASVALDAAAFPVSGVNSYSLLTLPATVTSLASKTTVCISSDIVLSLGGDPVDGAEFQWESSPAGANSWSPIIGATTATYTVSGVNTSTDFRCVISCGGTPIGASPSTPVSVLVNSPGVVSTTPGTECGPGPVSVTLEATATVGATLNWYDVPTGGTEIGTGPVFMTPPISMTTTYYVAASEGGGTASGGQPTPLPASTGFAGNNYGLVFDAVEEFTLNTVDVYSTAAGGSITIELTDASNNVLQTAGPFVIPAGTGTTLAGGATPTTFILDFVIPPGTDYRLRSASHTGNIIRDNPIGANYSYPIAIGSAGNLTAGLLSGAPNTNTYYYFFNWQISTGCESPRVPVVATIVNDPPVCPANFAVCIDAPAFVLTGATPDGGTYSGNGVSNGMFNPAAAGVGTHTITYTSCSLNCTFDITVNPAPTASISIAETSGTTNNDGVLCQGASATLTASGGTSYAWSTLETEAAISVSSAGTYTVTVTNANGCTSTASVTIVVNALPVVMITPSDLTICAGQTGVLTASGATSYLWSPGGETTAAINVTASGAYAVVGTDVNGCTGSANASVTVNPAPELSQISVQPTTCLAADGSIDLMVSGTGPFTYNWATSNGSGLVQGLEDQSGLTVGTYDVTVTNTSDCSATLSIALVGPGNCDACPGISTLVADPLAACVNQTVSLTASGLVDMGDIYGIVFKYSTTALVDPYTGGTTIATIPNSSLGGGGTMATTTTSFPTGNDYFIYAILDVLPTDPTCRPSQQISLTVLEYPTANPVTNQAVCNGSATAAVNFTSPNPGTVFNWTNNNTSIGLAASGTGDIASFVGVNNGTAPVVALISVTPVQASTSGTTCEGDPITFTITVNPTPSVNVVSNQVRCNGTATAAVTFSGPVAGTTYAWTNDNTAIGLAAAGTGNIASFTATNATLAPITATITVTPSANGCPGAPIQFTITVNPTPTVAAVSNQTLCGGSATTAVAFSGTVPGTTFNWTNSAPSIGLAASGSGNIASFTATNTGGTPVVATITVTPVFTANGLSCSGTPVVFTITVNPTAQVNQPANVVTCGGASTVVNFTTTTPGTTYTWTNSNTAIGLAAGGSGNISFTAATVLAQTVATIVVTPSYINGGVSCPGTPRTFTITVNPLPTVDPVGSQTMCSGTATTAVTFTGSLPGTVFQWTNDNPSIGLAASGSGNIASFITQNTSPDVQVATITVTPVFNVTGGSCPGTPISFTITVYPLPIVNVGADVTICENQVANLTAQLGGGATGGTWSGGAGTFGNANSATTTYTPALSEYGTTFTLTFMSNDPAGPCPAVSDALQMTVNTLPVVFAGEDVKVCPGQTLSLASLGATITANGSGVTTGMWSTSGTGTFQPSASFPGATTYVPSAADYAAGFVNLTLTSADPAGPCMSVNDVVRLGFKANQAAVCNDNVQVSLDGDGVVEVEPDMVLEGTYDEEFYTVAVYVNNVSIGNTVNCSHVGKTLQVRVTDNCTNNYCWGTIKVEDKWAPKLTCSNINVICAVTNYTPNYLQNVLGIQNAFPVVEENCPPATLSYVDDWVALTCDDPYTARIHRTWTAEDASGNLGTCLQIIYLDRRHVTDVQFPADVTINCDANGVNTTPASTGSPYLVAFGQNWPLGPTTGTCELQTAYVDQVLPVCDGTYKILRTWTVYDWCLPTSPTPPANPAYFIQVIKVVDETGPTIACPANLTVSTDPFTCCGSPNLPDVLVEDACSRVNNATARIVVRDPVTNQVLETHDLNGSLQNFAGNNLWEPDTLAVYGFVPCLPLGGHTVTYTVEDDCGNTSSCTFRLTIDDGTPPVAACDEFTQVSLGVTGEVFINATTFDDGSYDNCSSVAFKARRMDSNSCQTNSQFHDQVKFCCSDINDTVTVILRVYDVDVPTGSVSLTFEENNSNECMVQVYVDDKLKPTCVAPANVTVSCENFDPSLWAYGFATSDDNCCVDTITATNNFTFFDTLCSKGTITRTFRAFDCGGLSTQCTQRIFVNYEQDYWLKFPNDVIVTVCNASGNYGEPEFNGEDCELLGVSFEDEIFTVVPDACFKIERTWTIINWCTYSPNQPCVEVPNPNPNATTNNPANLVGPTIAPLGTPLPWQPTNVRVNPTDPQTLNYSVFYHGGTYTNYATNQQVTVPGIANNNCFKYKQIIKIIDGQKPVVDNCPTSPVEVCDLTANDPQFWNESYWYDNQTMSHDLCEAPTDLCITATDLCSGSNISIRYILFLDLNGDGVMETVVSSTNPPGYNNVQFGNAANPNFAGGTPSAFDFRPVPANQKYGFTIQNTVSGNNKTACVRWNTIQQPNNYVVPQLPYGTHKIKWVIMDGCGNEEVCEYTFEVKDCKKPTVVCINGLSVNIMPTQMIALWDTDFLQYTEDNCTPANKLVTAIRKSGTGTGFPLNPDGTPQKSVTFTCAELGTQFVELWSIDLAGNADYCETYVIVQDNMGVCGIGNGSVAGALKTEQNNGLEDATVSLSGSHPALPGGGMFDITDQNGKYILNAIPLAGDFTITPMKDNDPLNGVSTFDLVLINKHILGLEPLNTPYKMIAADANNSRSITTFDIVELRKLILGIYTELPNNTSWRFVDKAYTFPNQNNPFATIFPETIQIANMLASMNDEDFVSVKTGDVNGNAVTSSLMSTEDRTSGELLFDVTPTGSRQEVKAGEVFTVNFNAAEKVSGYQFTLQFPNLEVLDVAPGTEMTMTNFGVFNDKHSLTTSFDNERVAGEFAVTFRAKKAGALREMLKVSSQITKAEGYKANEQLSIALRFNGDQPVIVGQGFELYQNQPNPWVHHTQIGFYLPEASEATLTVFDEAGRVLYGTTGDFGKGYNAFNLDRAVLNTTGVLFYKVETATDSAVKTMIQTK
ncbi:MAG: hypothetical protein IPM36_16850 [Lewinellaceae bacterium]|nr:hypothetical protein [Lewinellaceae bacterium]